MRTKSKRTILPTAVISRRVVNSLHRVYPLAMPFKDICIEVWLDTLVPPPSSREIAKVISALRSKGCIETLGVDRYRLASGLRLMLASVKGDK